MTSNTQPFTTGDDIESSLDIIEANGGIGEFEQAPDEEAESIPRWLFPRFNLHCPTSGAQVESGTECGDCGEVHEMEQADMYLSRSGVGPYDTDVETVVGWLAAPRNIVGAINLIGEPGGGKTALIEAATTHADRTLTTVLCTPDHTKDSLFLRFVGEDKGDPLPNGKRSPYTLGPIPYAAMHGHTLYLDEWMMLVDGVKPILYSLSDGRRYLPEGNVDGSALEIHPDFRLILSSNPMVRGASMPEPMGSRCASTTLTVETSAAMLKDLAIDESVVAAWEALGTAGLWRPQIREMRLADYWLSVDPGQSVSAFVPEHCPESQREAVRNTVVSFLGGNVRADGRLVVS